MTQYGCSTSGRMPFGRLRTGSAIAARGGITWHSRLEQRVAESRLLGTVTVLAKGNRPNQAGQQNSFPWSSLSFLRSLLLRRSPIPISTQCHGTVSFRVNRSIGQSATHLSLKRQPRR